MLLFKCYVLGSVVIFIDDILLVLKVLCGDGCGKIFIVWLWVYLVGGWLFDGLGCWWCVVFVVLYDFMIDCVGGYVCCMFGVWCGFLQVDDFVGYVQLFCEGVIYVVCFVYVRWCFVCIVKDVLKGLLFGLVYQVMKFFVEIYCIEGEICDVDFDEWLWVW